MSRNYNLRIQAVAGMASQAPVSPTEPEWRLYSDMAALQPPSPSGDRVLPPSLLGDRVFPPDVAGETSTQTRGDPSRLDVNSRKYIFPMHATGCGVSEETCEEPNSSLWQTIER
jgi:hypothetical protein